MKTGWFERSDRRFVQIVALAALLDAADRADTLRIPEDRLRVPVDVFGLTVPSPALPTAVALGLGITWALGAALMLISPSRMASPVGAPLLLVGSGLPMALDQQHFANHTFLLWCLTALIAISRASDTWLLRVTVRSQISVVYVAAAIAKLRPTWWSGDILVRSADGWLGLTIARDLPLRALTALAIAVIAVELFLAVAIWPERLRLATIMSAAVFHLGVIAVVGNDIGLVLFAVAMLSHFALPARTTAAATAADGPASTSNLSSIHP